MSAVAGATDRELKLSMTTRKRTLDAIVYRPWPSSRGRVVLVDLDTVVLDPQWMRETLTSATRAALPSFIERRADDPRVRAALGSLRLSIPKPSVRDAVLDAALDRWTHEDRPLPALRALHGLVWEELFATRAWRVLLQPDAARERAKHFEAAEDRASDERIVEERAVDADGHGEARRT